MVLRLDEKRPEKQTRHLAARWLGAWFVVRMAAREERVHLALMAEGGARP